MLPFQKYKIIYASRLCEYGFFNEALKYIENISNQINLNPNLYLNEISKAYKLAVPLHSYLIELKVQKDIPFTTPPVWFQQLQSNFQTHVCKNYNKVMSLREQYNKLQSQAMSTNNLNVPITPVTDLSVKNDKKVISI